ncbi:MAG: helix-turn-helix domain-containing protein [Christensenellales bacterium]
MSFPAALKNLRESRHMSQTSLANALGITKGAVSLYENGKREPSLKGITAIADFFDVDMNVLLGRAEADTAAAQYLILFRKLKPDQQNLVIAQIKGILAFQ